MTPTSNRQLNLFKRVLAVTVIVVIGATVYTSSLSNPGGDLRRFRAVKADLDKGRYTPTSEGVIVLSPSDRMVTHDGLVYVTGQPPGLILFPRWRGKGASIVATGWSATDLQPGQEVQAVLPTELDQTGTQSVSRIPPVKQGGVRVTKSLGEGWYVFERREE